MINTSRTGEQLYVDRCLRRVSSWKILLNSSSSKKIFFSFFDGNPWANNIVMNEKCDDLAKLNGFA